MSQEKIYRWFRFYDNFANEHANICNRPDGNAFLGMYTRLLALSLENDGIILVSLKAKVTDSIAVLVNESNLGLVRRLITILTRYDYMQRLENGSLFFPKWKELVRQETATAKRVRKHRANSLKSGQALHCNTQDHPGALHCNTDVTPVPLNKIINKPKVHELTDVSIEQFNNKLRLLMNEKGQLKSAHAMSFWKSSKDDVLDLLKTYGYLTEDFIKDDWYSAIESCLARALPVVVAAAAIAASNHKGKITNKINYFKRCFINTTKDPERYIENFAALQEQHNQKMEELCKIARTPWLTSKIEDDEDDED